MKKEKYYIKIDGLTIEVKIVQERASFGRTDCLVIPIAGNGEKWVQADSIMSAKQVEKKAIN